MNFSLAHSPSPSKDPNDYTKMQLTSFWNAFWRAFAQAASFNTEPSQTQTEAESHEYPSLQDQVRLSKQHFQAKIRTYRDRRYGCL